VTVLNSALEDSTTSIDFLPIIWVQALTPSVFLVAVEKIIIPAYLPHCLLTCIPDTEKFTKKNLKAITLQEVNIQPMPLA
jgi:hypothetical protein